MFGGSLTRVSNRADWLDCVEMTDQESGQPIDLSTVQNIEMAIHYPGNSPSGGGGSYGGYTNNGLRASLTGGEIVHVQPGVFQFWFRVDRMRTLTPQIYDLGMTITDADGLVYQLFVCQVDVVEGYV